MGKRLVSKTQKEVLQSTIDNEVVQDTIEDTKCAENAKEWPKIESYEEYLRNKNSKVKVWPFFILIFLLFLPSCKSVQYVPIETIKTEYKTKTDSVYLKDSIFIDRWHSGDTLYLTKEVWRYKYKERIDTLIVNDTIPTIVEVEKAVPYIPTWYKYWTTITTFLSGLLLLIAIIKFKF